MLQSVSTPSTSALRLHNLAQSDIGTSDYHVSSLDEIDVIPPIKQYVLTCDEIENLQEMYKMLYPTLQITHIDECVTKFRRCVFVGR